MESIRRKVWHYGRVENSRFGYQAREVKINRFTNRIKFLALLKSVGREDQQVLASVEFRSTAADSTYNGALTLLDGHFNREESLFVKTQTFCAVRQAAGEEYRNYLVRVEGLSRDCDFGSSENAEADEILSTTRQRFCLNLSVIGLRDSELHK